ncbi:SdiA-regulated domain-containing protein [uncultured Aquimarina sp.]|uniref:SdiA-regulated domain-containing protein n=1 Tax=uncultured Aquimarina sp. TaxID=575652 RepID=UPI0026248399|nr:SdiA-regulated domain-containing protein [uncultured Aquimarina sp.]
MKLTTFFLLLIISLSVSCQKKDSTDLIIINGLSKNVKEISGITKFTSDTLLYAINDSGNDNILFCLNQKGEIIKKIKIPNSKNVDWEDLTYDHQNNIYIGDFGNNYNNRKDLAIYKVSDISKNDIEVRKIEFSLEDQKKFPPGKKNKNFDIEAFVYRNGSFYLFTKNRSSKFNGETKLYKVSDTPRKQIAKLIGSYKTCDDANDCFISGAAINATGDKIALLTYNKIFMLSDFKGDDLFNGTIKKIKLDHFSQKEGICFKNDTTLLIVDEKRKNKKGRLYEYHIK